MLASKIRTSPEMPHARRLPSWLHATEYPCCNRTKVRTSFPVVVSQSLTVPSAPVEARRVSSGLHDTERTVSVCPFRVSATSPVTASHILSVRSNEAEARRMPSLLQATELTRPSCAFRVRISFPVAAFQILTVASRQAEARNAPSGLHHTEW